MGRDIEKPEFEKMEKVDPSNKINKPLTFEHNEVKDKRNAVEKIAKINDTEKDTDQKERQQIEEDLNEEVLKGEFIQKASTYKAVMSNLQVEVAGNKYQVNFSSFLANGKVEQNEKKLTHSVEEGKVKLKNIDCRLDVLAPDGNKNTINLNIDVPVTKMLNGDVRNIVKTTIENAFGGTSEYYKKLQAVPVKKEEKGSEVMEKQHIETFKQKAHEVGAKTTLLSGEKYTSLIVEIPEKKKQIHISTVDRTSWHVAIVSSGALGPETAGNSPKEILNLIEKEGK